MMYADSPDDADCPLCGETTADREALRLHLMCQHRKSELTDLSLALLGQAPA